MFHYISENIWPSQVQPNLHTHITQKPHFAHFLSLSLFSFCPWPAKNDINVWHGNFSPIPDSPDHSQFHPSFFLFFCHSFCWQTSIWPIASRWNDNVLFTISKPYARLPTNAFPSLSPQIRLLQPSPHFSSPSFSCCLSLWWGSFSQCFPFTPNTFQIQLRFPLQTHCKGTELCMRKRQTEHCDVCVCMYFGLKIWQNLSWGIWKHPCVE